MALRRSFTVVGLDQALKRFRGFPNMFRQRAAMLMERFAEQKVLNPAIETYVPVMDGDLRGSLQMSEAVINGSTISVAVGAGDESVPYALAVHENPRSGKTGGVSPSGRKYKKWATVGQWKYLETPALIAAQRSASWLRKEAQEILFETAEKFTR